MVYCNKLLSLLILTDLHLIDVGLSRGRDWWSIARGQSRDGKFLAFSWFKDLEGTHEAFINCHHGTCIIKLTTIIGSRKDGDKLSSGKELVAILDDLMSTTNQI